MSRLSRSALIIAAVIIWLFGIVAAYFWAHKPFDLGIVIGLGRTLASVLVWLMIVSVAAGLGYRMVGGWLGEDGPLARIVALDEPGGELPAVQCAYLDVLGLPAELVR